MSRFLGVEVGGLMSALKSSTSLNKKLSAWFVASLYGPNVDSYFVFVFLRFTDGARLHQGCQMVYFQTKNPDLGKFRRALDRKMLIYFINIWNILRTFCTFYDHLVHFVSIWCIFSGFGIMYKEKSGNPGLHFPSYFVFAKCLFINAHDLVCAISAKKCRF
jgi:hypothetical protein